MGSIPSAECTSVPPQAFCAALDALPQSIRTVINEAPYVFDSTVCLAALQSGYSEAHILAGLKRYSADLIKAEALRLYGPTHPQAA